MGKSQLSYKRSVTDKLDIKGVLSEDCVTISYKDENKDEREANVADLLKAFAGKGIAFSIQLKSEEELELMED